MAQNSSTTGKIPVLLLKTKSAPADGYEELFSTLDGNRYRPIFVPVLEHRFKQDALDQVRESITSKGFIGVAGSGLTKYGALIFTSQRAVEAFSNVVEDTRREGKHSLEDLLPPNVPLYVVGPATARGLRALNLPCPIVGEHTGNGDALAGFILEHYHGLYHDSDKPPILFLVGEKRRDIIPTTLQSENLPQERRSRVDELVVYETGEMLSFKSEFSSIWQTYQKDQVQHQWVVVFSPTGCKAMLESLGLLDATTGKAKSTPAARNILVATIGPTTRDYLINEFGFSPDVSAECPSPDGIAKAIRSSSPHKEEDATAGTKRKADASLPQTKPKAKAARKQTTLEETLGKEHETPEVPRVDQDMKDASEDEQQKEEIKEEGAKQSDEDQHHRKPDVAQTPAEHEESSKAKTNDNGAIEESSQREKKLPSNILEKGIIYFFTRNRVGIEDSDSVGDLQRTFFVLRPLPPGAKIVDGALPDLKNNRLLALPKKAFPKSKKDKFMAFVEKAPVTIQDLKDDFFRGSEYETRTQGTRQQQPVATVGEGVYAITRTEDRTTHLAYALTIPTELGEVQEDLGLRSQGSFIISVKNPKRSGPASAQLPQGPEFPEEIIEEFRGLAWSEVKPKYLDYENCQILLIGESTESAMEPLKKDQKHGKEEPKEELEALEHEDELRVKHLHGDDTIFDDLNISKKDYSQVPTTW
ncbi:tetrapyrrole biosynthesis, uroporphyrinogen III synthase [Lophiotrema nucula]|uniref:Tetrapyrrole biosynthesis, uroporphyrinogen III synthase n=1 Tax=Lophiotrema nucula TaxID=690887 RepID=A0A6A5Z7E8_9PLEO|nr:tetrapyrrole biosynthesis, uroporphyrinogen III synthase [Lophiotrema nucula]